MEALSAQLMAVAFEFGLFAAVIFLIFGLDDLAVDLLWLCGIGRNAATVDPAAPVELLRFAIAIPAWDETAVIGDMLATARARWADANCRFYVGIYPNDLGTMMAVAALARADGRIQLVINDCDGPTTKGGCLNCVWQRVVADAACGAFVADALLIHDAEDVVDAAELRVLSAALATADYAQLPVVPLVAREGPWVSGHYCDEFAEAHGKELPVRSALGGPLPTAGVGCAFRIAALRLIAAADGPFHADCLTEDYELGVRLSAIGAVGRFVRARTADGALVASRAFFPHRFDSSIRQKTRWLRGIALEGWDRLGWPLAHRPSWRQRAIIIWMLWRDRRAMLSAVAILLGYFAMVVGMAGWAAGEPLLLDDKFIGLLLLGNFALLLWRLAMRAGHTTHVYGWQQGLCAVLRQPVSNMILVMTAWRAVRDHLRGRHGELLLWDKTVHHFPVL